MKTPGTLKILLADLVYKRRSFSPLPVPFVIAKMASFINKELGANVEIKVIRTIEQFYSTVEQESFDIAGFSHYIWNANLSNFLSQHIKIVQPNCAIIFGGPNFPVNVDNQPQYLADLPAVDFFIEKEGEIALKNLLIALIDNKLDIEQVKGLRINSVRSIKDGKFLDSPLEDRVQDLDSLPSPYLNGLLDEFLEQGFTPMVENNRGCPFTCSYCGESDRFYSKVAKHSLAYLKDEYEYVAQKMSSLSHIPFSGIVYFTDSNTGMYPLDIDICKHLNSLQKKYNWPKQILTSTGKNSKERVLECIDLLNGALTLTASVQSTDPEVLENINRKNISINTLMDFSNKSSEEKRSFSEIILGLPGDSYAKHLKSVEDMVYTQVNELRLVQLMILPDTPMSFPEYLSKFKMKTKFRLLVKGFEKVKIGKNEKSAIEFEEICVSTEHLPFRDYLKARIAGLLINLFYNNLFSKETFAFFKENGLSVFEYITIIIELEKPKRLSIVIDNYVQAVQDELFDSIDDIKTVLKDTVICEKLQNEEIGKYPVPLYTEEAKKCKDEMILVAKTASVKMRNSNLTDYILRDLCKHYNWDVG